MKKNTDLLNYYCIYLIREKKTYKEFIGLHRLEQLVLLYRAV